MKHIQSIIQDFSETEAQNFQSFLKRKNRRGDAKNLQLFLLLRKGKRKHLDELIYGKKNKNTFHALSKRLQDNLIDFVANQSFETETSEEMQTLKWLLASRIFFEQGHYKLAFKIIRKAEVLALEEDLYAILNEIYHTQIQYAKWYPNKKLDHLLKLMQENLERITQEQQLNVAYASLKYKLATQEYDSINTLTAEVLQSYNLANGEAFTYKSLSLFMKLLSTTADLHRDFYHFSPFLIKAYETVSKKGRNEEKHLYYHLEILHTMSLTYLRNKEFETSLKFIKKMEQKLSLRKGKYKSQFQTKINLIKALNLQFTGNSQMAITLLEDETSDSLDILLAKAMCYFQQENYRKSFQHLYSCQHSNSWYEKKMGLSWVLKKNMMEILLLIEMDKPDVVWNAVKRFKMYASPKLKKIKEDRVIPFLSLVETYYENPKMVSSEKFKELVENSFTWKDSKAEDLFVMSFYAWLKSKMENISLYQTTLNLVQQ